MLTNFKHKSKLRFNPLVLLIAALTSFAPVIPEGTPLAMAADRAYPYAQAVDSFVTEATAQFWEPEDILADVVTPDSGQPMEQGNVAEGTSLPMASGQSQLYLPSVVTAP